MDDSQRALRAPATLIFGGVLLAMVAGFFHPDQAPANDHAAAFADYARSDAWIAVHLGQFVGMTVLIPGSLRCSSSSTGDRDDRYERVRSEPLLACLPLGCTASSKRWMESRSSTLWMRGRLHLIPSEPRASRAPRRFAGRVERSQLSQLLARYVLPLIWRARCADGRGAEHGRLHHGTIGTRVHRTGLGDWLPRVLRRQCGRHTGGDCFRPDVECLVASDGVAKGWREEPHT